MSSGERFYCGFTAKVWTFDSISTTTLTILTAISIEVSGQSRTREREKQIVSPSSYFYGLYDLYIDCDQSAREESSS